MNIPAKIVKIKDVKKHPNADALDLVFVDAWQCVSKKDEFKQGELAVYISIDNVVEERPEFEFLRKNHFRIKTIKLRGEISQGLCLPLSILKGTGYMEDQDVSDEIGAKHYEKPISPTLSFMAKGNFPSFLKKTDEDNLRSNIKVFNEFVGFESYITMKIDGSSGSAYVKNGEFGVCSRNLDLKDTDDNVFWQVAKKYDLPNKLKKYDNLSLQYELAGPKLNGNKQKLTDYQIYCFNLWDISTNKYKNYDELVKFCKDEDLPLAPLIWRGVFNFTFEELTQMADKLEFAPGIKAEGMILRRVEETYSPYLKGRLSVKILNQNFLLENKE